MNPALHTFAIQYFHCCLPKQQRISCIQ